MVRPFITWFYPFSFLKHYQIHSLLASCQSHWKSFLTRPSPIILFPSDHSQSDPVTSVFKNSSVVPFALRMAYQILNIVSQALHHLTWISFPTLTDPTFGINHRGLLPVSWMCLIPFWPFYKSSFTNLFFVKGSGGKSPPLPFHLSIFSASFTLKCFLGSFP